MRQQSLTFLGLGQVMLNFYADNQNSNPAEVWILLRKMYFVRKKIDEKEAGNGPFKKKLTFKTWVIGDHLPW